MKTQLAEKQALPIFRADCHPLKPRRVRSPLSYFILFLVSFTLVVGCTNPAVYIKTTNETDSASSAGIGAVRLGFSAWRVSEKKRGVGGS